MYLLEKEGFISYTDLMERLSLDQTGQLNFHLKKLENLIGKDNKSYFLTDDGKQILKILNINKRILSGEDIDYLKTKGSKVNRIGVIVCNCNTEISNILNINALESYLNKLNNVVSVKISNNLCQERNQNKIRSWITENFINKIVIAACSPRTHQHIFERLFQGIIDKTNIEIANIREQCCWVHDSSTDQLENLTILRKAQLIIEAAILRCTLQKEIKVKRVEVEKSCVILGGGIAGMNIGLNLARAGFKVYLLEKTPTLGGKIARWHKISEMGDCSICFVSELIGELAREENIEILTNVEVTDISGEIGNFTIELIKKARYVDEQKCTGCTQCVDVCAKQTLNEFDFGLTMRKTIFFPFQNCYPYVPVIYDKDVPFCLDCRICERVCANGAINLDKSDISLKIKTGAIVLAIGSDLYEDLEEFHYDPKKNIITSAEFERIISSDGLTDGKIIKLSNGEPIRSVSIIQEVGPSNYLCDYMDAVALKYISVIEMKNPECEVNVFYDLSKIKDKNEIVLQYTHPRFLYGNEVKVHINGKENFVIADSIEFQSDLIILNTKLIPNKGLKELRKIIDFNLNENGFIIEGTLASGIFGVGTVYGPLDYKSTMSTVNNITIKIISLLSNDYLLAEYTGIEINEEKCGLCTLCIQICPYNAISIDSEKISIDKFKCKGCGMCESICPTNAIEMNLNSSEKVIKTIEVFSKFNNKKPKIIAFCCQSCGYAAADDAGLKRILYNPNVFIISVPCAGRVDSEFIIKSFELGFDGIMVIGCRKDSCRYYDGIEKVNKKVLILKDILGAKLTKRIILKRVNSVEGSRFAKISNNLYKYLLAEMHNET